MDSYRWDMLRMMSNFEDLVEAGLYPVGDQRLTDCRSLFQPQVKACPRSCRHHRLRDTTSEHLFRVMGQYPGLKLKPRGSEDIPFNVILKGGKGENMKPLQASNSQWATQIFLLLWELSNHRGSVVESVPLLRAM